MKSSENYPKWQALALATAVAFVPAFGFSKVKIPKNATFEERPREDRQVVGTTGPFKVTEIEMNPHTTEKVLEYCQETKEAALASSEDETAHINSAALIIASSDPKFKFTDPRQTKATPLSAVLECDEAKKDAGEKAKCVVGKREPKILKGPEVFPSLDTGPAALDIGDAIQGKTSPEVELARCISEYRTKHAQNLKLRAMHQGLKSPKNEALEKDMKELMGIREEE